MICSLPAEAEVDVAIMLVSARATGTKNFFFMGIILLLMGLYFNNLIPYFTSDEVKFPLKI